MSSLFPELEAVRTAPEAAARCILCANFAGGARDPTGYLFRRKKGYCNDERHFGGIHNVIQDIVSARHCPMFDPAAPEVAENRKQYLKRILGDGDRPVF